MTWKGNVKRRILELLRVLCWNGVAQEMTPIPLWSVPTSLTALDSLWGASWARPWVLQPVVQPLSTPPCKQLPRGHLSGPQISYQQWGWLKKRGLGKVHTGPGGKSRKSQLCRGFRHPCSLEHGLEGEVGSGGHISLASRTPPPVIRDTAEGSTFLRLQCACESPRILFSRSVVGAEILQS